VSAARVISKMLGAALITVGVAVLLCALVVVADLAAAWWAFSSMSSALAGHGWDKWLGMVVGVLFTILFVAMTDGMLSSVFRRKTMEVVIRVGVLVVAVAGVMYYTDRPYSGAPFDIYEDKPNYKYYLGEGGQIMVVPMSAKVGPQGQMLRDLDEKTATELERQRKAKKATENKPAANTPSDAQTADDNLSFWERITENTKPEVVEGEGNLNYWVEKIEVSGDDTIVHMACESQSESEHGRLFEAVASNNYFTDKDGQVYMFRRDTISYNQRLVVEPGWFTRGANYQYRSIRPGEIYRYAMHFRAFPEGLREAVLYDSRFGRLELKKEVRKAIRIPSTPKVDAESEAKSEQWAQPPRDAQSPPSAKLAAHGEPSPKAATNTPRSVQVTASQQTIQYNATVSNRMASSGPRLPGATDQADKPAEAALHAETAAVPPRWASPGLGNLSYWVERVSHLPEFTSVHVGCRWNGQGVGKIYAVSPGENYAVDDAGQRYELASETRSGKYPADPDDAKLFLLINNTRPCQLILHYKPMASKPETLTIHDLRFSRPLEYGNTQSGQF
jgi:hypothetical protein